MIRAAIFDLDGLLIDSEPLWNRVEKQVFAAVGVHLTPEDCIQTTGLRIDEVTQFWFDQRPWEGLSQEQATEKIIEGVIELISAEGTAKPGAEHAVRTAERARLKLGLASSSPLKVIDAGIKRLGLEDVFEVIESAEFEPQGKPHPAVYLNTAKKLDISPSQCIAFEDSLNGVRAAKSAGMRCIAVPEKGRLNIEKFVIADKVLSSLEEVTSELLLYY